MEKFVIEGGVPLNGEVTPAGNKNAALPLLAACLLTDQPIVSEKCTTNQGCKHDAPTDRKPGRTG